MGNALRVCVRARARVCVCMCTRACVCVCACVRALWRTSRPSTYSSPGLVSHLQDAFSQPASSSQLPRKTAVSHREVAAIRSNESNSSVDSISRLFSFSRGNGGPIPTNVSTVTGELGVAWSRGGGTATVSKACRPFVPYGLQLTAISFDACNANFKRHVLMYSCFD